MRMKQFLCEVLPVLLVLTIIVGLVVVLFVCAIQRAEEISEIEKSKMDNVIAVKLTDGTEFHNLKRVNVGSLNKLKNENGEIITFSLNDVIWIKETGNTVATTNWSSKAEKE